MNLSRLSNIIFTTVKKKKMELNNIWWKLQDVPELSHLNTCIKHIQLDELHLLGTFNTFNHIMAFLQDKN